MSSRVFWLFTSRLGHWRLPTWSESSFTIDLGGNRSQTIPKGAVGHLTVRTRGAPYAPWVGLAAGTAIGTALVHRKAGHDIVASGQAAMGAVFGGVPGLVTGYIVHRQLRTKTVYRPPYLTRRRR